MAAVWMRFRTELRTRWRALLAVGLIVGAAGGVTLAALAGARRTDTAFDRLVEHTEAWDVLVNPDLGADSKLAMPDVRALPQVARVGRIDGLSVAPGDARSADEFYFAQTMALRGDVGYEFGRVNVSEGRMPRRDRPHEVLIDPLLAEERGWRVGDRIPLRNLGAEDVATLEASHGVDLTAAGVLRDAELGERFTATITGIGTTPEQIVVDEGFESPRVLFSSAFLERHPDSLVLYWGALVRLRHGAADLPAFRRGVEALVPDEAVAFQTLVATLDKADRAVRPSVGALHVFALVVGLTGLLVIGQAVARQTALDAVDNEPLRALGMTRRGLFWTAMLRAVVVGVTGATAAVVLAGAASPIAPIGVARDAEPEPGFALDATVLGLGFVGVVAAVLVLAALPAWRLSRANARDVDARRPSRVAAAAADTGLSVSAVAGVRMALDPGRGRTAVPVRVTMVGACCAVATLVAAGVFAASLDHLVSTPRLFGWNWDVRMSVDAEQVRETESGRVELVRVADARADAIAVLETDTAVARWATVSVSDVVLDGVSIPSVGIERAGGAVVPTVVEGALPRRNDEVALGALTKRRLGVGDGDVVVARGPGGAADRLKVVGTVVLPGLGTYEGSDKTALGEGAVLTRDALYRLGPDFGRDDFVVDFAPEATARERDALVDEISAVTAAYDPEGFDVQGVRRPSDIVAYDRVRSTPMVLAAVLALLASATVAHALVTAVRRRRRDLAMFATLGFTRRQVSSAVAWQATTVGVVALVLGIPLGIVGGRWAWSLLATDLGTVDEPRIPVLALAVGAPVALLLCNAVAYVPGRMAARIRPAVVLRSE